MSASTPFSLLVKPASADCNLRCLYCFYLEKSCLYPDSDVHRMPEEVLERMISSFMSTGLSHYAFAWQGGEPALMGVDFFRRAVELEERYCPGGATVSNGLQTNATLIDDEFAALLSKYRFLVGVSLDGPPDVHDRFRLRADGTGSHAKVLEGIDRLRRNRVEFNALVLVSSANVGRAREVYNYLCDIGIWYHQYIPCVEFDESGNPMPYCITGEEWGRFLCDLFDEWVGRDVGRVSIREFDAVLNFMVRHTYSMCTMGGRCNGYLVVEHNGDVYPCDFFVEPEWRLGNVMVDDFTSLRESAAYKRFGDMKSSWSEACSRCAYLKYCSGDCVKQRFGAGRNPSELSRLCSGWRQFYAHSVPELEKLALSVIRSKESQPHPRLPPGRRRPHTTLQSCDAIRYPSPGRNDTCFCGSGKKYKKCHGAHN